MAKNAKLGDGCIVKQSKNASLMFMSTDLSLIELKRNLCEIEGFELGKIGTQKSGYGGTKTIYKFSTCVNEEITRVADSSVSDVIKTLDKVDLFLWFMDDGSWHKRKHFMNLYSNMLNDVETNELIAKISDIYGISPKVVKDRKKDGRSFNYLYFPRELVKRFRPEFKEYVIGYGLESMYYKFGGIDYKEAI